MKILIRNGKHTKWEPVDVAGDVIDAELQKLLAESPLLTTDSLRLISGHSPDTNHAIDNNSVRMLDLTTYNHMFLNP